jgi:hypothetical protein
MDRTNPLGKCVEVWTSGRQLERLDANALKDHVKSNGELGIAVADQVATFV